MKPIEISAMRAGALSGLAALCCLLGLFHDSLAAMKARVRQPRGDPR